MNKLISIVLIFALSSMVFAASSEGNRAPVKMLKKYNPRIEPTEDRPSLTGQSSPIVQFNNRNGFSAELVDSSKNGYGMITSPTNPLFVRADDPLTGEDESGQLFFVYRQWISETGSSGQIGASFSANGLSWDTYFNLNGAGGIGRYPSAVGTDAYPYAIWNEYTGTGNPSYGGRPYYAYDEFGWDGGSFSSPQNTDLNWNTSKDLWVGSPVVSGVGDQVIFNIAYADWTRMDCWLFHSEAYEDGFVIFGNEMKILDETADFVGGDDEGSYTSSPVVDINDDGIGYFGASAYFSGADEGASVVADGSYHTAIFRMTTDHGATWFPEFTDASGHPITNTADKYYYIPDAVIDHMLANDVFPSTWTDPDECEGSEDYTFTELFMAYDFDIKVDDDGNPHFIMGVLPGDGEYIFPGIAEANGYYHFTIDKDFLDNPGPVGTSTGWNYSFVASTMETWGWNDAAGSSYWQISFPTLALGPDGTMFVVSSMISEGEENDPDGDPCTFDSEYPEWSNDVYVMKSENNGASWWCPYNASATPDPDPTDLDSPEEISAHAGSSADADGLYLNFQMPDYILGSTTGDPGDADHKCRVYVGYAELTSSSEIGEHPDCADGTCGSGVNGDVSGDGVITIQDIGLIVSHILDALSEETEFYECAGDFNNSGEDPDDFPGPITIADIMGLVNCLLGSGSCDGGGLARLVDGETAVASLIGNQLEINRFVGGIQFDGKLSSQIVGSDIVETANGKTIVYNLTNGVLETSSFTFEETPENMIVVSSVGENVEVGIVSEYVLMTSYPNPFNPQTTISYEINAGSNVELAVYNMLGQQVVLLVDGFVEAGNYKTIWNSTDVGGNEVASGIYMLKLTTENQVVSNKITLLR